MQLGENGLEMEGGIDICVIQYTKHLPCMKHCHCVTLIRDCKTITNDEYLVSSD
jgi:hypothetical protein